MNSSNLFLVLLLTGWITNSVAQCDLNPVNPSSGEYGQNVWIAHVYNYSGNFGNLAPNNLANYTGFYLDCGYGEEGLSFNSSDSWPISGSPSSASSYVGQPTNSTDNFAVMYRRRGFPEGFTYRFNVVGPNGEDGHDNAYRLYVNGRQVASDYSFAQPDNNVWSGRLGPNDEVTFLWRETGGESYGRLNIETAQIPSLNDESYGQQEWRLNAFTDQNYQNYAGFYTKSGLNFDTAEEWGVTGSPSDAANYEGSPVPNNYHSYSIKRHGFETGYYSIDLRHDDGTELFIDGRSVYSNSPSSMGSFDNDVWNGYLGPDSFVEFRVRESLGNSRGFIRLNKQGNSNDIYYWSGESGNSLISLDQNWASNTAAPPNGNSTIIIPAGVQNYPNFNIPGAQFFNVVVEEGAEMTVSEQLSIRNRLVNNGTINAQSGEILFTGNDAQSIQGKTMQVGKMTVNNSRGVEMYMDQGEKMEITDVLDVQNGTLRTNNQLYLTCSFSPERKTAQIAELTNGNVSGLVTVEQCLPARRAFRFISSSVSTVNSIRDNWQEGVNNTTFENYEENNQNPDPGYGIHITGSQNGENGFDASPSGNPSLFGFDNTSQSWFTVQNTDQNTLTAGTPYRVLVRGDRSSNLNNNQTMPTNTRLRATGNLIKGNVQRQIEASVGDFIMIGNPYQAAIDINQVLESASTTNINPNFYYIWDPTLGGASIANGQEQGARGAYVTVDVKNGTSSFNQGIQGASQANQYLQPMQAAFVQVTSTGEVNLQMNEAMKAIEPSQTSVFNHQISNFINIQLFDKASFESGSTADDGLRIKFSSAGNSAKDLKDAPKMKNLDENLSRNLEGELISLESRDLPQEGEVLPLNITQYRNDQYVFKIKLNGIFQATAYLKDNLNGNLTELEPGINDYNFSIDTDEEASLDTDRFAIVFGQNLNVQDYNKEIVSLYPNPLTGTQLRVKLSNYNGTEAQAIIIDAQGKQVRKFKTKIKHGQIKLKNLSLETGLYLLKLKVDGKSFTKKFVKE